VRIAVLGAGGVGGYFGGRLAEAGEEVHFIARGAHLEALRTTGLQVESVAGDFVLQPAHATADPASVGAVDAVLVAVKTWQLAEATRTMRPLVGRDTIVVPLLNGVDAPDLLRQALGPETVLGGLCRIISFVAAPGLVRHTGVAPSIAFGEMDGARSARVERLRAVFTRARGVAVEIPADIRVAMWRKFLFIASWGGLAALARAPIGVVRNLPETRRLLQESLREIHAVANAAGIALPAAAIEETLAFIDGLPADGTASMQRDLMEGRRSELDAHDGAVVRMAERFGIETPVHGFIYSSLLPVERRARKEIAFRL